MMNSTSLQSIINHNCSTLPANDLNNLFATKQYPRFELDSFRLNNEMVKREQFLFFLKILERWNESVANEDTLLNDCDYFKNEFIFSWLKSIAVQNSKFIDCSLRQLYQWYNSNKKNQPQYRIKKENINKSRLEDWQIRNSYKSNLPLEIDSYKRRHLYDQQDQGTESHDQTKIGSKTAANSPKLTPLNLNSSTRLIKQQNNYLRRVREEKQVENYLSNYKKQKIYFYKNMAKDYYKKEFNRDKFNAINAFQTNQQFYSTDHIKDYRIKTSMDKRPFGSTMAQTAYSQFYRPANDPQPNEQTSKSVLASTIDGLSLMQNPFDVKLRKKKKTTK